MHRSGKSFRFHGGSAAAVGLLIVALAFVVAACANTGGAPAASAALPTYAPPATSAPADSGETATSAAGGTPAAEAVDAAAPAAAPAADAAEDAAADAAAPVERSGSIGSAERIAAYPAEIVAEEQVAVMAQVSGQVLEVTVDVGDHVQVGDVIVRLDGAALDAQRAQALASLEAAKSQLDLLKDPAKDADIAAAQAAVNAAAAAYQRAVNGPTDEERRAALAQLKSAQAAVTVAQAAYNRVKGDPNIGMLPQSLQLEQATLAGEAAQAQYDKLMKGATPDQIAGAEAQLAGARATLQRLLDGAKPAQIGAAEAQMHAAENALYLATLQADKATITAPIDGVVSKLQTAAGAMAGPTAPLMTLLSTNVRVNVQVEETRLPLLAVGQPALIRVDAYPDRTFSGAIAYIAPELDAATRTVQVAITPEDAEGLLHPGMSATVQLAAAGE